MTKGEMMVALGIGGLALTFIISIIVSVVLHRKEKRALAEMERVEAALAHLTQINSALKTEVLDRRKAETEILKQ